MNRTVLIVALLALSFPCASAQAVNGLSKPSPASAKRLAQDRSLYWYDGGVRRGLRIDSQQQADFTAAADGVAVIRKALGPIDNRSSDPARSPVFLDPDAPALKRALPGGVVIELAQPLAQAALADLLARFNTTAVRSLDSHGLRWLISSDPGIAALELANRLHESGEFASARPNWWRERVTK